jgi:hypothetical protein
LNAVSSAVGALLAFGKQWSAANSTIQVCCLLACSFALSAEFGRWSGGLLFAAGVGWIALQIGALVRSFRLALY